MPVPHFGAALTLEMFNDIARRLKEANYSFILEPHIRLDPSGNAIEMKHFTQVGEFRWT